LLQIEQNRYRAERLLREHALRSTQQTAAMQHELQRATERIARLETAGSSPFEAAEKLRALEIAQESLRRESVELGRRAMQEAEEAKASLRMLISDSQRARNASAPENDQSARIIELEQRIQRLSHEIERLSQRAPAAAEVPAPASKATEARAGFLKAMLDANVTLRRQIKEAA
jgi:hypothetical protein